ncbi:MAG: 1-acyl-sn-glycerol-3-phosphate acyltransferase [Betaproteobacteria bacterium]|nr:1-acyl-sn-glycerol-3-phosphate acyltransferase [Betaproteobacteria bacterium]
MRSPDVSAAHDPSAERTIPLQQRPRLGVIVRSTLFAVLVVLITPPYALASWLVLPLPAHIRYRIVTSWSHVVIALARAVCGIRYRIQGRVPQDGPYIVLSKHQSAWETLAFQVLLPPQVLVLKRGLLWIPFFGWGLATLSPITVKRAAPSQTLRRLLEQGKDRLAQGFWIVIFPEGTRVAPGSRTSFQAGGAWLACRTRVAVVPVAHNAGELWPKNGFIKYPGTVTVSIGEPIACEGVKADALNRNVADWIEREMARITGSAASQR